MSRLVIALLAFAGLAALAWTTISDQRLRLVTLLVLGLFALKTWLRRHDVMHPDGEHMDADDGGSLKADR